MTLFEIQDILSNSESSKVNPLTFRKAEKEKAAYQLGLEM